MFRVCVHRYLLASFLALMGIAVPSALAQDPNPKPADKSAGDAAAAASPAQTAQEVDPLKKPIDPKKKKQ